MSMLGQQMVQIDMMQFYALLGTSLLILICMFVSFWRIARNQQNLALLLKQLQERLEK